MEESKEQTIKRLQERVGVLQKRVGYLEKLLDEADISYDKDYNEYREDTDNAVSDQNLKESQENQGSRIISETITKDHAKFFYSMFKGRTDVYSKRAAKPNAKTGKTGYYTQCWNFWKDGLCPKKRGVQIKCADCAKQRYKQLTGDDLMNHLIGAKEDCSDVIGIYPMLSNETCNFLVFDFDNHESDNQLDDDANTGNDWVEEVNSMRMICSQNDVDVLVERSRSGKGAHIWIFFEEPVPSATARKFGDALLTKGAESVNQKTFQSYDRMLPAQDHMPAGGLGNLIALPLQGRHCAKAIVHL